MAYLIGTDEAGYGPNLGPLLISATVWRIPDQLSREDLYTLLDEVVSRRPTSRQDSPSVPIADSKALYNSGSGLGALEYGVFVALAAAGLMPASWRDAWSLLAPQCQSILQTAPWYAEFDQELPLETNPETLQRLTAAFRKRLEEIPLELITVRSVAVFPERFNELVERFGSKGLVLSRLTIGLIGQILPTLADESVQVQCDKHGGRNKYGSLLQEEFPDPLVEIWGESRSQSVYRWGPEHRRIEARFVAKGESFLPTALASMVSKYLRELAMTAFNTFWRQHVPGLRPTAGYPVDARRFREEIVECQEKLGVADRVLWRNR